MTGNDDSLVLREDPWVAKACEGLREGLSAEEVEDRLSEEGLRRERAVLATRNAFEQVVLPEASRMLAEGCSAMRVQDALIETGFASSIVFAAVDEVLSTPRPAPPPPRPIEDVAKDVFKKPEMKTTSRVVGGAIFALGAIVWLGNVTGSFPTFPGLGYGLLVVGGFVFGLGDRFGG